MKNIPFDQLQSYVDGKMRSVAIDLVNNHHCHVYRNNLSHIDDNLTQITVVDLRHQNHIIVALQYSPLRYELSCQQLNTPYDVVVRNIEDETLLVNFIINHMQPIPHNSTIHYLQHNVTTR
jgi:hypothetical protein